jgi:stress-induced morphogen
MNNKMESIKKLIQDQISDSEVYIYDESSSHEGHFESSSSIPSHLKIKIISDYFKDMSLVSRHRKINDIMGDYFTQGLHALKIVTKTKNEADNE